MILKLVTASSISRENVLNNQLRWRMARSDFIEVVIILRGDDWRTYDWLGFAKNEHCLRSQNIRRWDMFCWDIEDSMDSVCYKAMEMIFMQVILMVITRVRLIYTPAITIRAPVFSRNQNLARQSITKKPMEVYHPDEWFVITLHVCWPTTSSNILTVDHNSV